MELARQPAKRACRGEHEHGTCAAQDGMGAPAAAAVAAQIMSGEGEEGGCVCAHLAYNGLVSAIFSMDAHSSSFFCALAASASWRSRYCAEQSSKSLASISMKSLTTLHVRPCTVEFQWERLFVYSASKTSGSTCPLWPCSSGPAAAAACGCKLQHTGRGLQAPAACGCKHVGRQGARQGARRVAPGCDSAR